MHLRGEMEKHPLKIMIRCDQPSRLASRMFERDSAVEVQLHEDKQGLMISTRDADAFYLMLNDVVLEDNLKVEAVTPADEDVHAVYQYLISREGE